MKNQRFVRAVEATLAERERTVNVFTWGDPGGPGRGNRGPIALLAAELGVSRSTAWAQGVLTRQGPQHLEDALAD
jgi:hypothetical protein